MLKEWKNKFQKWTQEITKDYFLVLTDDLDSLFTTAILNLLFGCRIGYFYDFHRLYKIDESIDKTKIIGCDLAVESSIKTFCNHVTRIHRDDEVNPLSANLNNFIGIHAKSKQYFNKYAGSTAIMVLSLYDAWDKLLLPGHSELTEMQKKILLCIDSYFLGYYQPKFYEAYHAFRKFQDILETHMFNDVLETHTKWQLEQFKREYKLDSKIEAKETEGGWNVVTNRDMLKLIREHFPMLQFKCGLFTKQFEFAEPVTLKQQQLNNIQSKHDIDGRVFSLSVTRRDEVKLTLFKEN